MSVPVPTKLLANHHVSPPTSSVPEASLPLTFFDLPWLLSSLSMKRILFYKSNLSTSDFLQTVLPNLKLSLSSALQRFFPLAGNIVCPQEPNKKPHILYKDGDSVPLIIVEAIGDSVLDHLIADDCVRDVKEFHPLVPELPSKHFSPDGKVEYLPILALQVTIFPKSGICISVTCRHSVADGKSLMNFFKSWASFFRSKSFSGKNSLPLFDRKVIKDPNGLEEVYLNIWRRESRSNLEEAMAANTAIDDDPLKDRVRATFLMNRDVIQKLKGLISNQSDTSNCRQVSSFALVCGFTWSCLVKSQSAAMSDSIPFDDDETIYFSYAADCRNRYQMSIQENYFGNCLVPGKVTARRGELTGENGCSEAAKLITSSVEELENGGVHKALGTVLSDFEKMLKGYCVGVAGSPKLNVYETDFGWGRPVKAEIGQIDNGEGAIALHESRDGKGGLEIGLVLTAGQMKAFKSIFVKEIKCLV